MVRNCPKCGYARKKTDDKTPEWQCPSCGIAYQKYIDQPNAAPSTARSVAESMPVKQPLSSMSATALFFILAGTLAVGYAVYKKVYGPQDAGGGRGIPSLSADGGPPPEALILSSEALAGLAQITQSKVVVFSTAWCTYCTQVKRFLEQQGVRYTELDLELDPRGRAFQEQYMVVRGFPVTIVGSRIVPGSDERTLLAALKAL